jgi:UDP-N-acetylmuramoylalanine--D-glutamate ligase
MPSRLSQVDSAQTEWSGKRVVILGLARQGKALARFFGERGAQVIVSDLKPAEVMRGAQSELEDLPLEYIFGAHPLEMLKGADLLCLSGGIPIGIPIVKAAQDAGVAVTNDAQLFIERSPAPVIGITGSAGKTTTTALLGEMARRATADSDRRVWVGGNIGNPLISELASMQARDLVIMELSSFQLELMTKSPETAVVLNITPNHLDRHKTMEAYTAAKSRILRFQRPTDTAVLGMDDPIAWSLRSAAPGKVIAFGTEDHPAVDGAYVGRTEIWLQWQGDRREVCPLADIRLRGAHNLLNVAAACAAGAAAEISMAAMRDAIQHFTGVEHRLQVVREREGVTWVNDSIATAPERAIAAIRSFEEPLVLLAGGRDKDLPWEGFADWVSQRVDHLVLFGEAAGLILDAVSRAVDGERPFSIAVCPDLESAVEAAARVAERGDVVLLAPGGTSYDEFTDFVERGERYMELVEAL